MDKFWVVTLFHLQPPASKLHEVEALALDQFNAQGIEEYSLSEEEVDNILGDRSYSGGDLPLEVLEEVEENQLGRPTNYRFFFGDSSSANGFFHAVKAELLCEAQVEEKDVQDWNLEWKKHYSPIEINGRLEIVPAWYSDYSSKSEHVLKIHPGMGFGTGSHETTFLCLKLFTENLSKKDINFVLDFGSGSGILGLAALKICPQTKVDFYDIDLEANKNCYENALLNGLSEAPFRLLLPEYRNLLEGGYELIFANILESILLGERDFLVGQLASGGSLILSGLLVHQSKAVEEAYLANEELRLIKKETKGDWVALLFEKVP